MSSNTRVQARPTYRVSIDEAEAVSLLDVIGRDGGRALHQTLRELPALRHRLAGETEAAASRLSPALGWAPAGRGPAGEDLYRLVLDRATLPQELSSHGVSQITLELAVGNNEARVRRSTSYRSASPQTAEVEEALRRLGNLAVNELLALTVVQRLAEQLGQVQGLREEVKMRATRQQELAIQSMQAQRYQATAYVRQ